MQAVPHQRHGVLSTESTLKMEVATTEDAEHTERQGGRGWVSFLPRLRVAGVGLWMGTIGILAGAETAKPLDAIDFNRDIRPILSQNCFFCHGPDEAERKGAPRGRGGLRLDTLEGLRMDLGGHAAVVPGKPDESELIRRLVTTDADEIMPPGKTETMVALTGMLRVEAMCWAITSRKSGKPWVGP